MVTSIDLTRKAHPSVLTSIFRGVRTAFLLIFCAWFSFVVYLAPDSFWMEYQAQVRRSALRAEIEKPNAATWAGEYRPGGRRSGYELIVAPQAGYLYESQGCMGLDGRSYGQVTEEKDRIRFAFWSSSPRGLSPELVPVTWGERHYLIPPEELKEFCARVGRSIDSNDPSLLRYFLRKGDEGKAASGLPDVPKEFWSYLSPLPAKNQL